MSAMADDQSPRRPEGQGDVLGSLPRARPARRSTKRDGPGARTSGNEPVSARPAARRPTAATAEGGPPAPRRSVPPAGYATPAPDERRSAPGTGELVSTAGRAAGEVVQLGAGIARGLVRAAAGRLGGGR